MVKIEGGGASGQPNAMEQAPLVAGAAAQPIVGQPLAGAPVAVGGAPGATVIKTEGTATGAPMQVHSHKPPYTTTRRISTIL